MAVEVSRFAQNVVFERLARAGYVMSGLLHLTIAYLAIRIAFGNGGGDADPSGALAVAYFAFAYSAWGFARGSGTSSARQNATMSARLMQSEVGTVALVVAGVVIVVVGVYHAHEGVTRSFLDDLKGRSTHLIIRLGVLGYVAKGSTIATAGALVIVAAWRSKPEEATGLDGALKTLGAQPYGVVLLVAAALGLATYGLYGFVMARSTKM